MLNDISYTTKERQDYESVEADHHYEGLDKYRYSQMYEDIQVHSIKVPRAPHESDQQQSSSTDDYGYIPVIHGSQESVTSLTQPATVIYTEVSIVAAGEDKGQGISGVNDDKLYENVRPHDDLSLIHI